LLDSEDKEEVDEKLDSELSELSLELELLELLLELEEKLESELSELLLDSEEKEEVDEEDSSYLFLNHAISHLRNFCLFFALSFIVNNLWIFYLYYFVI